MSPVSGFQLREMKTRFIFADCETDVASIEWSLIAIFTG